MLDGTVKTDKVRSDFSWGWSSSNRLYVCLFPLNVCHLSPDADGVRGWRTEPPGGRFEKHGDAFPAGAGGGVAVWRGAEPKWPPGGHDIQLPALLQPPGDPPHPKPHHHGTAAPRNADVYMSPKDLFVTDQGVSNAFDMNHQHCSLSTQMNLPWGILLHVIQKVSDNFINPSLWLQMYLYNLTEKLSN